MAGPLTIPLSMARPKKIKSRLPLAICYITAVHCNKKNLNLFAFHIMTMLMHYAYISLNQNIYLLFIYSVGRNSITSLNAQKEPPPPPHLLNS